MLCDLISLAKLLRVTYVNNLLHVIWHTCYKDFNLKKSATTIVYMCFFTLNYVLCDFNSSEKLLGFTYFNNLWNDFFAHFLHTCPGKVQQNFFYLCLCILNYVLSDLNSLEKLLRFNYINNLWHFIWHTCCTHVKEKCNKTLSFCTSVQIITCCKTSTI